MPNFEESAGQKWFTGTGCQWYSGSSRHQPCAYRSDAVLSAGGGLLDFYLHNVDGVPAGANPSPVLNNATNSLYQTYGRYTARFKVGNATLSEYHAAWLLWPQNDKTTNAPKAISRKEHYHRRA